MAKEIERKYLVKHEGYRNAATEKLLYRQGYLKNAGNSIVRVRIAGPKAYLTIKSANKGIVRNEYEYEIPLNDAQEMLALSEGSIISKYRYTVPFAGLCWIVDEFEGMNAGLVIAEIELNNEHQDFELPDWLGEDVSMDARYMNSSLSIHPYCNWKP